MFFFRVLGLVVLEVGRSEGGGKESLLDRRRGCDGSGKKVMGCLIKWHADGAVTGLCNSRRGLPSRRN